MIPESQGGLELKLYPTNRYSSLIFTDKVDIKSKNRNQKKHRNQRNARYWINKRNKKRKKK